jgi:tetratricopeptide (TPR) repeat protein
MELAVSQDDRNPDMTVAHASILSRIGRQDEAVAVLEEGLAKNADHPRLNAHYARTVEMGRGLYDEAEERLRKVVSLDPFLSTGWQHLGRLLETVGRWDEAIESYEQGLRRSSDNAELHGALGTVLAKRGESAKAMQHLREAIRLGNSFQPALHVSLGGLFAEAGRLEEARKEYDKVLAVQPKHPGARNNLAIALYRAGEVEEAEDLLTGLVEDMPNNADGHNNLAAIAVERQQWAQAEKHARRTLELDPSSVQGWNNLGIARDEQSDPAEARSAYERALALDSDYWPAYLNLAMLLRKTGDAESAVEAFGEVLSRMPTLPQAHFELGELFSGPLGDPEKARNHYRAFLRHAPQDPRVGLVQQKLESLVPGAAPRG